MTDRNLVGKRYTCPVCGIALICVKPGAGRFACHSQPIEIVTAKPLPSSD